MSMARNLLSVDPVETSELLLVTCVRYDPVLLEEHDWHSTKSGGATKSSYLLLPFHVQRLRAAAQAFGWTAAIDLLARDDALQWFQNQCEAALAQVNAIPNPSGDKSAYKVLSMPSASLTSDHLLTRSPSCAVFLVLMGILKSGSSPRVPDLLTFLELHI